MSTILAFNWKMNPTSKDQVRDLIDSYSTHIKSDSNYKLVTFPPSIFLDYTYQLNSQLDLGVQDICEFSTGSCTGQISAKMLTDFNTKYVLIGHSETRKHLDYDKESLSRKTKTVIESGLIPVYCIGFQENEMITDIDLPHLGDQLKDVMDFIDTKSLKEFWIAYEPIWAIGTGKNADNQTVYTVVKYLKKFIMERYGDSFEGKIKILYGGSVSSKNIAELIQVEDVDGFLIGGAALKSEEVSKMIDIVGKR